MKRKALLRRIANELGPRSLIWFGTRGDDIAGPLDLPNLTHSFSVINTFTGSASVASSSLEHHTGVRVDLDAHDIDDDFGTEPYLALRAELLRALSAPSAVFAYRPSTLLSSASFARPDSEYLGMFKDHQSAFEHKPWVESALAKWTEMPQVPWSYVTDEDVAQLGRRLSRGPIVLRRSHSSGGTAIAKVSSPEELRVPLPGKADGVMSVAPFLPDTIPLNVGGVVWRDGVTVHLPSVQIIGHPDLTARPFGYCGNDFGVASQLDTPVINQVEKSTKAVGAWLRESGYRGAFGIDFLLYDGAPHFIEVNPRLQGSTHLSVLLSRESDETCIISEHLAAFLGFDAPETPLLRERVAAITPMAHLVQHWLAPAANSLDVTASVESVSEVTGFRHADVLLDAQTACARGATLGRYTFRRTVTSGGFDLTLDVSAALVQPVEKPIGTRTEVYG